METSKIIKQLTKATGKAELLNITHKGARRSLCLQSIRKAYVQWLDSQPENGLKKINLEGVPIRSNGQVIGYL